MTAWIFQGNPDQFDVQAYVRPGARAVWTVNQEHYAPLMRVGDRVFIWQSAGAKRGPSGVVATATICELPRIRAEDPAALALWRGPRQERTEQLRVGLEFGPNAGQRFLDRKAIASTDGVRDLVILRMANQTNYPISSEQEVRLVALWTDAARPDEREGIPDGITGDDVRQAIRDFDAGAQHEFGESTGYDLVYEGRRYPPKAILGLAARRLSGRTLGPYDFKGGLSSRCFAILTQAGFPPVPKPEDSDEWTEMELVAAVDAYVAMMEARDRGESVNKAAVIRELLAGALQRRTDGSVEFRMRNISAVIHGIGGRWLEGYKPAKNVGARSTGVILDRLTETRPARLAALIPTFDEAELSERARSVPPLEPGAPGPPGVKHPRRRESTTTQFERSPAIRRWVLDLAAGQCELCGSSAPFQGSDGDPYLEVHHVVTLANGGPDTLCNAVGLCPNCHRKLHLASDRAAQVEVLYAKLKRLQKPEHALPRMQGTDAGVQPTTGRP